jgi:hypothetical protein
MAGDILSAESATDLAPMSCAPTVRGTFDGKLSMNRQSLWPCGFGVTALVLRGGHTLGTLLTKRNAECSSIFLRPAAAYLPILLSQQADGELAGFFAADTPGNHDGRLAG